MWRRGLGEGEGREPWGAKPRAPRLHSNSREAVTSTPPLNRKGYPRTHWRQRQGKIAPQCGRDDDDDEDEDEDEEEDEEEEFDCCRR